MPWFSQISSSFEAATGSLLDLFFPLKCLGCGKEGSLICGPCSTSLRRIEAPYCTKCGKPLNCHDERSHQALRNIDGIRSVFFYEGVIRQAVLGLKYRHMKALSHTLSGFLLEKLPERPFDIVVPVPLHRNRLYQRGYNQSALLARDVAEQASLALGETSLARLRETPPQARTLSRRERLSNVDGAFACVGDSLKGKRVIIIDDVFTTGATLDACAKAARDGGALEAWGLTVATEI